MNGLPGGRRGQALAVALTVLVLAAAWLGVAAPALAWFDERGQALQQQEAILARMRGLAAAAPALQRQLAAGPAEATPAQAVFEQRSDAVAGAALQQAVQDMAGRAGAAISSAETLPAETVGGDRRMGLHVTVTGTWPVIVGLLAAVGQAQPRMLVDDLSLHQSLAAGTSAAQTLEAAFTVIAFHAGGAAP